MNFVGSSTNCATELKLTQEDGIEELLDIGLLETSKWTNQTRTLQRSRVT